MRNNQEYTLYKQLATYLRYQYRNILYHFDPTGLNLSKAQSGMLKAIQNHRGYPDLVIYEPRNGYHGLFIELKRDGERIHKRDGSTRKMESQPRTTSPSSWTAYRSSASGDTRQR